MSRFVGDSCKLSCIMYMHTPVPLRVNGNLHVYISDCNFCVCHAQVPYADLTPLQAAVGVVQKVCY